MGSIEENVKTRKIISSSLKIPGSDDDYHYLGHGYNARTGKFIKVQLFKKKPVPGINNHPYTKLYYEDPTST